MYLAVGFLEWVESESSDKKTFIPTSPNAG